MGGGGWDEGGGGIVLYELYLTHKCFTIIMYPRCFSTGWACLFKKIPLRH